ncbi:hypothetical protein AWZ03_008347 [Drosophila navojoa]|uniref:Uncharacterized protein n=1 Tax=Drosophila navojoa TaxID=7232 RepID=A0A484BA63_DRONA|nr:hypothetical protein AWZ03_008347 [Drosophila navojoa]
MQHNMQLEKEEQEQQEEAATDEMRLDTVGFDCSIWPHSSRLPPIGDSQLPTADWRLPTGDCQLATGDWGPQISDCASFCSFASPSALLLQRLTRLVIIFGSNASFRRGMCHGNRGTCTANWICIALLLTERRKCKMLRVLHSLSQPAAASRGQVAYGLPMMMVMMMTRLATQDQDVAAKLTQHKFTSNWG